MLFFFVFFSLFIFLCCFLFIFPVVLPYCGPCCATPSLGRSPRANRWKNWWLRTCAHLQKKISKICDFHFFSFDLCTDIILKQINKIKNLNIFCFFSLFIFLCCFPFFPRCASLLASLLYYPVVHPTAAPQGLQRRPGTARFHFPPTRARVGAKRSPRLVALGSPPRGDTTGRHNGETKRETKWKNENEKR